MLKTILTTFRRKSSLNIKVILAANFKREQMIKLILQMAATKKLSFLEPTLDETSEVNFRSRPQRRLLNPNKTCETTADG
jgi:hypothetical protein